MGMFGDDGSMVKITSEEELKNWLEDKPNDWAQVIAARAALRVLPIALTDEFVIEYDDFTLALLSSTLISWAAGNITSYRIHFRNASIIDSAATTGNSSAHDAIFAIYCANETAYRNNRAAATSTTFFAARAVTPEVEFIWLSIEDDIKFLERSSAKYPAMNLTSAPLWSSQNVASEILHQWQKARSNLLEIDNNFIHWIDWYERRLLGKDSGFDIPHDKDRTEDKAILIKLADATNQEFWDKGAEYVNAQLGEWLREARQRAQERYNAEHGDGETTEVPAQNSNAITFKRDEAGRISIDARASSDEILTDDESRERHQMALVEASSLQEKCATSNSGAQLSPLLLSYIENLGDSIEQIRPSLSVLKGEKLRQTLVAYQNHNSMMQPLSDEMLLDLKTWESAHNMMVAFQPKLNALDTAMLGPDRQPAEFTPDDLRTLTKGAEESQLLREGTKEILDETASQADGINDNGDRRFIWNAETAKNLVTEAFNIAKDKPKTTGIAAVIMTAGVLNPTISIPLGVAAAHFLMKHRNWVETKMGNAQTWKSLFSSLCDKYNEIISFDKNKP